MSRIKPTIQESIMAVYEHLPPSERKLADTILSKLNNLASYSATELAAEAVVSKATAARFFRRAGYRTFGHARRQARAEAHLASPLYALAGVSPQQHTDDVLASHVAADIKNLSATFELQNTRPLAEAATLIAGAPRVGVVGLRNGHFIAMYAASLLAQLKEGVASLPASAMTLAEDLASLRADDVLIVMDFRRRAALLRTIVNAARRADVHLVFLANPGMSALSRPGDTVMFCLTEGASVFDSYVAAVSIVNYLGSCVARELGKASRKRLETIETLHEALGDITH